MAPLRTNARSAGPMILCLAVALLATACASDDAASTAVSTTLGSPATSAPAPQPLLDVVVFGGKAQGIDAHRIASVNPAHGATSSGQLAFQVTDLESQTVDFPAAASGEVSGPFGPLCFVDSRTVVVGNTSADGGRRLGVYEVSGQSVGNLELERLANAGGPSDPTSTIPVGCAVMADGRLVTAELTPDDRAGQLVIWPEGALDGDVIGCPFAGGISPISQIAEDGDSVLVSAETGVLRFDVPSTTAAEACVLPPTATGDVFVEAGADGLGAPSGIVAAGADGGWYVASGPDGVINQYDSSGALVRAVLTDPDLAPGTLARGPDGQLYLTDVGDGSPSSAALLRLDVTGDAMAEPEMVADDVDGPLALTIYVPGVTGARAETLG